MSYGLTANYSTITHSHHTPHLRPSSSHSLDFQTALTLSKTAPYHSDLELASKVNAYVLSRKKLDEIQATVASLPTGADTPDFMATIGKEENQAVEEMETNKNILQVYLENHYSVVIKD